MDNDPRRCGTSGVSPTQDGIQAQPVRPHRWSARTREVDQLVSTCLDCGHTARTSAKPPAVKAVAALSSEATELDSQGCEGPLHRPLTPAERTHLAGLAEQAAGLTAQIEQLAQALAEARSLQSALAVGEPLRLVAALAGVDADALSLSGWRCLVSPLGRCVYLKRRPTGAAVTERLESAWADDTCVYCADPFSRK